MTSQRSELPANAEITDPAASIKAPVVATTRCPLRSCQSPPTIAPTATNSSEYRYGMMVCAFDHPCNCVSGPRNTDHEYTTALMPWIHTAISACRARLEESTAMVVAAAELIA